jgi:hypothetical protein
MTNTQTADLETATHDENSQAAQLRRWRLILGGGQADGTGCKLNGDDQKMDGALGALYGDGEGEGDANTPSDKRDRGLGKSSPKVARWLGDIRNFFPTSVVRVMQKDALERLNLRQMLLEKELLESIEPDIHMATTLLSLNKAMPDEARETARIIVRKLVEDILARLRNPLQQAISGSLNRAIRNRRPRHNEINWNRTIRANLKHYQPEYRTIIPETRIGYGKKRSALREVILMIDQSGSMGQSVVYSGIFGAVMASMPALKTHVVVFDTAVVDLTDQLTDPVEVLFGTQLGGGTDGDRALRYCEGLIRNPRETIFIHISDLYDNMNAMLPRIATLVGNGVQYITLLALSDNGAPSYDQGFADALGVLGIPAFACTPDLFPDLMAAAINREDISLWAAKHELVTKGKK